MEINLLIAYIGANGAIMIVVLIQVFRIQRRLGCGGSVLDQIRKSCPLFNVDYCKLEVKTDGKKGKKSKVG